jgi:hypothetical protein
MPAPTVPLTNPDGTMRREWYLYFQARDRASRQTDAAVEPL